MSKSAQQNELQKMYQKFEKFQEQDKDSEEKQTDLDNPDNISNIDSIYQLWGNGFYAYDLIMSKGKLWVCEIGLKIYDKTYVEFLKKRGIEFPKKISNQPNKMKEHYRNIILASKQSIDRSRK